MIHYHGGPITPETCALRAWKGKHAFISWADQRQLELAASISQSFALDNGAFSLWKSGITINWDDYYEWTEKWLSHPACDWAIIPDVIDGTEAENDALITQWPHAHRGVPVWHLNESIERLQCLADKWPRVALGSTAEYDVSSSTKCLDRLAFCLPKITKNGFLKTKLHGLRMLNPAITKRIPLSSGDSTNVAKNIGIDKKWKGRYMPATKEARVDVLIDRIESVTTPHEVILPPYDWWEVF